MHVKENKLLLSGLPKYYGLKQVPLQYTLVGYDEDWLVIATEVGVLICYNEKSNVSFRIPPQGYSKIECIELKERVLVWGTETGYVGIKEIQSGSDPEAKQMISKVHDTNVKFASYHDNKVASVDKDGKITISEVDCARGVFSSSRVIHSEPNKILSLFFISAELILLTTVVKTSLLKVENGTCSVTSVGSKDRKNGEFGACVLDIYTVLVARPGLRLWYANTGGDVLKTIQLRKILNECPLECCCEDVAQETKLASLLPKSGIINRVERIDEKLVIIQLKHLFVFVETVDLTVVGWLKESVLDWYTSHRALVLLYKDNIIKRYIVTQDVTLTNSEFSSVSVNVENVKGGDNITHNDQSVKNMSENGNLKSENGQLAAAKTLEIEPPKPTEIITQIPKYQPVPKEKLEEITNFVKSICERDENSEITPLQKVPNLDIVSNDELSVTKLSDDAKNPSIDSLELSNDVIKQPCDIIQPPCDVIKPPCDVIKPPCDVIKPPCDLTEVKVTIEKTYNEDKNNLKIDLSGTSTEEHTEHTDHTNFTDHTDYTDEHTDPSDFCDHTPTPNDDTLISCHNTMTPQDSVTNSLDVTCNSHDVTCDSSDVTPTSREPSIIMTSGGSDNMETSVDLEMSVTDSVTSTSPERSVMEELKTNIGKKMINSLGLTPSPSKHKQLITSDSTLPLYEPDKISLSSQDTISIHSSSTNCDEDEDKIAIRIKRKKHRSRKEKSSSNDTLDSVASGAGVTIVEEGQEPTFLPTNIPQQSAVEEDAVSPVLQLSESGEVTEESSHVTEESSHVTGESSHVTEESSHVTEENDEQSEEIGLDVSSILIGLANLEEGILRLDDLGLPVYEFDDPYSGEEDVDSEDEIGDSNDQDEHSSVITSSSTILDGDFSSNISNNVSSSERSQQRSDSQHHKNSFSERRKHQQSCDGETSDIYSTRSASESTADLYDLDRRPSVEFGEDPLRTEPAASPPPHQLTVPPPILLGEKSGGSEDSVFLTDDSWLELRGPTMSRMYVTISCLAVSSVSVWCTDNWGNVYYSPNTRGNPLSWERVSGAKLVSLSVSDSGSVVWGVTTNKRAVVRFGIESGQLQGTDWSEMMLEALTVAVDESSVWLLVAKGKQRLFYRSGVSSEDPQGEKWVPVSTQNLNITSLSVHSSVVWGVLDSGKLVIRHGITPAQPLGNSWHVLSVNNVKRCHVGRNWEVGWVVDSAGIVHFQCGVVPTKPRGSNLWWQVRFATTPRR